MIRVGIGQDSHRFTEDGSAVIAGIIFEDAPALDADSDGDVVFHSICNAITSISGVSILGDLAIRLCHDEGIRDSRVYLERALETLQNFHINHVAITIEGARPKFQPRIMAMRESIAAALNIKIEQVGLTVTSGDGLTSFGKGEGLQALCILTVEGA
ncbi:MAG: 2-C-methyl-D-erythritol 2,4-cyclodiphosphate synthase [Simkaniaceae bacterium]|nr:2-C-methyl-D-erythritol 2,4-cyclodiphosphate synthase [Simkaniaceae bacterium]